MHKRNKINFTLLLIGVLFLYLPLQSAEIKETQLIKKIQFIGLSRSDESTLRKNIHSENFIGKPFNKKTKKEIKSRLWSLKIFSKIKVKAEPAPDGTLLKINLKEKWTLIPIPMFNTDGDKTKYGIFVLEQNLFGLQKMAYLGGMFSSDGVLLMFGYIDPSLFGSKFTFKTIISYKNELFENSDPEESLYSRYNGDSIFLKFGLCYKLSSKTTLWYYSRYQNKTIKDDDQKFNAPQEASALHQGIELDIKAASFYEWKTVGLILKAKAAYYISQTDGIDNGYYTQIRTKYNLRLGNQTLLKLDGIASLALTPTIMEERLGGRWGFKTLPQDKISCDDYFSTTVAVETRIINLSWMNITAVGFWEYGQFNSQLGGWEKFYGVGGGLRFYLKKVAIPAMGYDIAWNMRNNEIFSSFAIGMQM